MLKTTSDTPNKGRFFWSCPANKRCGFFLWEDNPEAHQAAQELQQPKTPTLGQRKLTSFGYSVTRKQRMSERDAIESGTNSDSTGDEDPNSSQEAHKTTMGPQSKSTKRKQDDLDDDFFDELSPEEVKKLETIMDKKTSYRSDNVSRDPYRTPETTRTVDMTGGFPTPSVTRTLFPDAAAKRQKTVSFEQSSASCTISPASTPSAKYIHAQPTSSPSEDEWDVAQKVMDVLKHHNLESSVLASVQDVLETFVRKTAGIIKGRATARVALKQRDEKIAQLQNRVAALENKEKMLKDQLDHANDKVTQAKAKVRQVYEVYDAM
jgi:flagellar motility protein MotE (MotC chaperone)